VATTNHTATRAASEKPARRFVGRQVIVMRGESVTRGVIARAWIAKRPLIRHGVTFFAGNLTRARVVTAEFKVVDVTIESGLRLEFLPEVSHA